jgi:cation transport ATPase
MERLLQYMDDLDDLVGVIGLSIESIRRFAQRLLAALAVSMLALAGGFFLALRYPSAALIVGLLLLIVLALRALVAKPRRTLHSA